MKQTSRPHFHLTRRRLLALGLGAIATATSKGFDLAQAKEEAMFMTSRQKNLHSEAAAEGRLVSRPQQPQLGVTGSAALSLQALDLEAERESFLYVPYGYRADQPAPLVVSLHGAGGSAHHGLALLQDLADEAGFLLLAPSARWQTWDVIRGDYGPDVSLVDQALEQIFSRYTIDPTRIAIGGFSDGASYALSLGIINGLLFTYVIAFSPGFMAPTGQEGAPRFFISHGTRDQVLPIDRCSRRIVPQLKDAGYDVRYLEFDGGHTVPGAIARDAVEWFRQ